MPALERAQTIADLTVLTRLQRNVQRQVFETQAIGYMVENLDVQWLGKIVFNLELHLTPAS